MVYMYIMYCVHNVHEQIYLYTAILSVFFLNINMHNVHDTLYAFMYELLMLVFIDG